MDHLQTAKQLMTIFLKDQPKYDSCRLNAFDKSKRIDLTYIQNTPKRRMTLQQKAKSEGINPVGILMVIVILGCILACPYNTAKDHLNYFDYFMLGNALI